MGNWNINDILSDKPNGHYSPTMKQTAKEFTELLHITLWLIFSALFIEIEKEILQF